MKKTVCNGIIYKVNISQSVIRRGDIYHKVVLKYMMNHSCRGCEICNLLRDVIKEEMEQNSLNVTNMENGKLYKARLARKIYFEEYIHKGEIE